METVTEYLIEENKDLKRRVKQLEGHLKRYGSITDKLYSGDYGWVMSDAVYDKLAELEEDIKRERRK